MYVTFLALYDILLSCSGFQVLFAYIIKWIHWPLYSAQPFDEKYMIAGKRNMPFLKNVCANIVYFAYIYYLHLFMLYYRWDFVTYFLSTESVFPRQQ